MSNSKEIILLSALIISVLSHCNKSVNELLPVTEVIVGTVSLSDGHGQQPVKEGQIIKEKDTLNTLSSSKAKIRFPANTSMYLNNGTQMQFGTIIKSKTDFEQEIYLRNGELYLSKKQSVISPVTYKIVTAAGTIIPQTSCVYVKSDPVKNILSLIVLSDSVELVLNTGEKIQIASCNGLYMTSELDKQVYPLTDTDIENVKSWVGETVVDETVAASQCKPVVIESKNLPPEWTKYPSEICSAGVLYQDTIAAIDPENGNLRYTLVSAPQGMEIDSVTGVLHYKADGAGSYDVHVKVQDMFSNNAEYEFTLTVSSELAAKLVTPLVVSPAQNFSITACPVEKGVVHGQYTYRFDCDGDGKFELPGGSAFTKNSSVKNCVFMKAGTYKIAVEIKNKDGRSAVATKKIVAVNAPLASLVIKPSSGMVGSKIFLDASASNAGNDSGLLVRYDFNGDGTWDLPANGGYFQDKTVNYIWGNPGAYKVIVQVKNQYGLSSTASASVVVTKGLAAPEIVSPDTVHVSDSLLFECRIKNTEFSIVKYEWNFNNDSIYEIQTSQPKVRKRFTNAGIIPVSCRISDEKGQTATQKKTITVLNLKSAVNAGRHYKTWVNTVLDIEGKAEDKDSKIVGYYWDFDCDGKADWSSEQNGKATCTFNHAGNKKIVFTVKTDDGGYTADTATVEVINRNPKVSAGDDIVTKAGRKLKLNGTAEDPDGKIALYEWDFDGDGTADFSSTENGMAEHEFKVYSTVIFMVTDSDGGKASDTLKVIICPDGMETVEKGKYCIDTYEYPNKKGSVPLLNVSYQEAKQLCMKEGKHLCTSQEWEYACNESNQEMEFPYGKMYVLENCNTLGNPVVKNRVSESGSFFPCRSSTGVYDMSGNASEWTESSEKMPVARGGSWQNGESDSKCTSKFQLQGGRKYFYVGFRCCK